MFPFEHYGNKSQDRIFEFLHCDGTKREKMKSNIVIKILHFKPNPRMLREITYEGNTYSFG